MLTNTSSLINGVQRKMKNRRKTAAAHPSERNVEKLMFEEKTIDV
jgi:hypothetical protein